MCWYAEKSLCFLPHLLRILPSLGSWEDPPAGSGVSRVSGIPPSRQGLPSDGRAACSICRSGSGSVSLGQLRVSGSYPGNDRAGGVMKRAGALGA